MMLCKNLEKNNLFLFLELAPDKWTANEKFDGDRTRLWFKDNKPKFTNRKGINVTNKYPELHDFRCEKNVVFDGEMCVLDENDVSQFNEGIAFRSHCQTEESITQAMKQYPVTYMVFDILEFDGEDLRSKTLKERREIMEEVLNITPHPNIQIVPYYPNNQIKSLWSDVIAKGGEGIVLKDLDSYYIENKRKATWLKVKNVKEVDLVFVNYREHNKGITVQTSDNITVNVNGYQAQEIKRLLDDNKQVKLTIRHLGKRTKSGKLRQPTYLKLVE